MSDQCELCGGEVLTSNDGSDKCCCNPAQPNRECTLDQWTSAEQFNRIQAALALLKRVESGESVEWNAERAKDLMAVHIRIEKGESVEVRKVNGEWPEVFERASLDGFCFRREVFVGPDGDDTELVEVFGETFPEAAEAWNKGAR